MSEIRYLTRDQVRSLLPSITEQVDMVESTYLEMAAGRVELPPKPGIHPRKDSFIHAMPAYLANQDVAAIKWVSGYLSNIEKGLPYIHGLMIMNDADTGVPIAVMDAAEITAWRTAAASGVCVRHFAPAGWRRAAIIGCGEQGRCHASMLRTLNPECELAVYDPDPSRVASMPGTVAACGTAREAISGSDVFVTARPLVEPAVPEVHRDWCGDRVLALPIDFNVTVCDDMVTKAGLFVTDDIHQYSYYQSRGHFAGWGSPSQTVGAALRDHASADLVVCANLGVGALDAAFAAAVLASATSEGVGSVLPT